MPSFDTVSELDMHEVSNAVDQANRELTTRYDFKNTNASYEQQDNTIILKSPSDFQLTQMIDILKLKLVKRNIDILCMEIAEPQIAVHEARQNVTLREGLDPITAKKMLKKLKEEKLKVQGSIQGEKIRITGKKRDDLQAAMALFKTMELELPLQFNNFRD